MLLDLRKPIVPRLPYLHWRRTEPSNSAWIIANSLPFHYKINTFYQGWMSALTSSETHKYFQIWTLIAALGKAK